MKISKNRIRQIIKEELHRAKSQGLSTDLLVGDEEEEVLRETTQGSLSEMEIEEMLGNYFKAKTGGRVPEDISRLSVLFPILKAAGLGNLADSYVTIARDRGPQQASILLTDLKKAISNLKKGQGN